MNRRNHWAIHFVLAWQKLTWQQLAKYLPKLATLFTSISKMHIFHHRRLEKSGKTSPYNLKIKEWDFLHVIGALDGKHVRIECPIYLCFLYYTSKEYFSMVLLAMCDASSCFNLFDFGSYVSNDNYGTPQIRSCKKPLNIIKLIYQKQESYKDVVVILCPTSF